MSNSALSNETQPMIIGYYPFRAKAQIPRLLCEYLHIKYKDLFLNPDDWELYKQNQARQWIIKDLPFLTDGDFTVTGTAGMIYYILQKSGRLDMLGKTLQDNLKITSLGNRKDLHNVVLGLSCSLREANPNEQKMKMKYYWTHKIEPIIQSYEIEAKPNDWYFGYITLMDIVVYELINQMELNFPDEIQKFTKLNALKNRVYNIAEINKYENSDRAVREFRPVNYFNSYKEKMSLQNSAGSSTGCNMEMEPEV